VEVLTGTPRRRWWTDEEKAAIVAESQAPGALASEIALRYGLHRNQLCRAGLARQSAAPFEGDEVILLSPARRHRECGCADRDAAGSLPPGR
jgi:transposase